MSATSELGTPPAAFRRHSVEADVTGLCGHQMPGALVWKLCKGAMWRAAYLTCALRAHQRCVPGANIAVSSNGRATRAEVPVPGALPGRERGGGGPAGGDAAV